MKLQLQLSKDRVRRTEIRHTETTKQRKYTINKLVETGKILLHNIKSIKTQQTHLLVVKKTINLRVMKTVIMKTTVENN